MKIKDMVSRVNRLLDAANYEYDELYEYLDSAIDEINEQMWTELPLVSDGYNTVNEDTGEIWGDEYEYDNIPDRHQRGYICYRTASGKLSEEEEVDNVFYVYMNTATDWLNSIITTLQVNYINDKVILMNADASMPGLSYYQNGSTYSVTPATVNTEYPYGTTWYCNHVYNTTDSDCPECGDS